MTSRNLMHIGSVMVVIISAVVGATALYFYSLWGYRVFCDLALFFLFLSVLAFLVELLYVVIIIKGFKRFIFEERIKDKMEQNLIAINACYKWQDSNIYTLPKMRIDFDNSAIVIKLDDVRIRKQIEAYKDQLSTALPDSLTVKDCFINNSANAFIIKYRDETKETRRNYKTLAEYLKHIDYQNHFQWKSTKNTQ